MPMTTEEWNQIAKRAVVKHVQPLISKYNDAAEMGNNLPAGQKVKDEEGNDWTLRSLFVWMLSEMDPTLVPQIWARSSAAAGAEDEDNNNVGLMEGRFMEKALRNCKEITLPSSVAYIKPDVFRMLDLTKLTGSNVRAVEREALTGVSHLEEVDLPECIRVGTGAFAHINNTRRLKVNLPKAVTIDYQAFKESGALNSINMDSVELIGPGAFAGCEKLVNVNLPNTLKEIGFGAFAHTGITDITIPESVETMGKELFTGCSKKIKVRVPKKGQTRPADWRGKIIKDANIEWY